MVSGATRLRAFTALDPDLPRRLCLALILFAVQGVIVLGLYSLRGLSTSPDSLPYGLQLDPIHGVLHLATGLVSGAIAFGAPRLARPFLQVFGVAYLALAVLGTFTPVHLGMALLLPENALHWTLGTVGTFVGFHPRTASGSWTGPNSGR